MGPAPATSHSVEPGFLSGGDATAHLTGADLSMPSAESLSRASSRPFVVPLLEDLPRLPDLPSFSPVGDGSAAAVPRRRAIPWNVVGCTVVGILGLVRLWTSLSPGAMHLVALLGADVVSGALAAFMVAPLVALVDSAIARSSAAQTTPTRELWNSMRELAAAPHRSFARVDFWMVNAVYVATYLTANICATLGLASLLRLALITSVNMWVGVKKDVVIAGTSAKDKGAAPKSMSKASLALFCARDSNAIGASFVLPRALAPKVSMVLPASMGGSTGLLCQLLAPPICELVNTPIHLLALDMFNRPGRSLKARARAVARQFPRSLGVRILRVLAAFSLGGISNRVIRDALHGMIACAA